MALNGNLEDFGIADVFQLIGQQAKTGVLEIRDRKLCMKLVFDGGSIVWASPAEASEYAELGDRMVRSGLLTRDRLSALMAECRSSARSLPALAVSSGVCPESEIEEIRELLTRDTIFEVLRWSRGSFHFSSQSVKHGRPPDKLLGAEQILMDGLRMIDEWQTFSSRVPSPQTVFRRVGDLEMYRQQATGDARHRSSQAERILELVNGRRTVQRVIDLSRMGIFDATRILAELRSSGCIEPVAPSTARLARIASERSVPQFGSLRAWVSGVLPVALLVLILFMIFQGGPATPTGVAIERRPLESARLEFEKRRVRHAVEAERFLLGDWPMDLTSGDRSGLLERASLTPSTGAPYYYVPRADELVLLAPEH